MTSTADQAVEIVKRALDAAHWPTSWERATSLLQEDASKPSAAAALLEVWQHGRKLVVDDIEGLSQEQLAWKPNDEEWSLLENIQHVAAGIKNAARKCVTLASGEAVEEPATEDAMREYWDKLMGQPYQSLTDAIADFDRAHEEMKAFLNSVSDETNIEVTHPHPAVGPMNSLGVALFQRAHDSMHIAQIAELKASAGFPAS